MATRHFIASPRPPHPREFRPPRVGTASATNLGVHTKIGRNAPCPCGSGTKQKRCCARNASPVSFDRVVDPRGGALAPDLVRAEGSVQSMGFLDRLDAVLVVLPYGKEAAAWHARERARLAKKGKAPPFVDGQLAAIAHANGLVLVTRNIRDFAPFADLRVESWFGALGRGRTRTSFQGSCFSARRGALVRGGNRKLGRSEGLNWSSAMASSGPKKMGFGTPRSAHKTPSYGRPNPD